MPMSITDIPKEEKWRIRNRKKKKKRDGKVVVEKRKETREKTGNRDVSNVLSCSRVSNHRLTVSLGEILKIIKVLEVKSPHNLYKNT